MRNFRVQIAIVPTTGSTRMSHRLGLANQRAPFLLIFKHYFHIFVLFSETLISSSKLYGISYTPGYFYFHFVEQMGLTRL